MAARPTKRLQWVYKTLVPNKLFLGYINFSAAPKAARTCEHLNYIVSVITNSCMYVQDEFLNLCRQKNKDGTETYFIGLYMKPDVLRPEDTLAMFPRRGARQLLREEKFKTLEEYMAYVNAPIHHGLVGLTFMLGSVKPINNAGLTQTLHQLRLPSRLGFFDLKFLAACPNVNKNYASEIAAMKTAYVNSGRPSASPMLPLAMIGEFEQFAVAKYAKAPHRRRLIFTILESAEDAYFYYIDKGNFHVIDNATLSCEMFDYKHLTYNDEMHHVYVMRNPGSKLGEQAYVRLPCETEIPLPVMYRPIGAKLAQMLPKPKTMQTARFNTIAEPETKVSKRKPKKTRRRRN